MGIWTVFLASVTSGGSIRVDGSIARDKSTWESGQSFWLVSQVGDQSEWTDLSPGISRHGNLDSPFG